VAVVILGTRQLDQLEALPVEALDGLEPVGRASDANPSDGQVRRPAMVMVGL
jgi:hypothetical protein